MKKLTLLIWIIVSTQIFILAQGWKWQNPLPQGNILWDICADANHPGRFFAVGDHGTILRKNNLSNWEIVEQGNHQTLLVANGLYAKLWRIQNEQHHTHLSSE